MKFPLNSGYLLENYNGERNSRSSCTTYSEIMEVWRFCFSRNLHSDAIRKKKWACHSLYISLKPQWLHFIISLPFHAFWCLFIQALAVSRFLHTIFPLCLSLLLLATVNSFVPQVQIPQRKFVTDLASHLCPSLDKAFAQSHTRNCYSSYKLSTLG